MVQGKTYSYNCKINKREPLPKEKWDIVKNTHEPIIGKAVLNKVQAKAITSIFSGFLICEDCGKKMVRNTAYYKNEALEKVSYNRYVCSTSKKYGSSVCTSHIIREDTLEKILLEVIDKLINDIVDCRTSP